jgi:hypothetical protein
MEPITDPCACPDGDCCFERACHCGPDCCAYCAADAGPGADA